MSLDVSSVSSVSRRPQSPKSRMMSLSRSVGTAASIRSISSRLRTSRRVFWQRGSWGFALALQALAPVAARFGDRDCSGGTKLVPAISLTHRTTSSVA